MMKEYKIAVVTCDACGRKLPKLKAYGVSIRKHRGRFVKDRYKNEDGSERQIPVYDNALMYFCEDCFQKESIFKFVKLMAPKPKETASEEDLYPNRFFGPH